MNGLIYSQCKHTELYWSERKKMKIVDSQRYCTLKKTNVFEMFTENDKLNQALDITWKYWCKK